MLKRAKRASHIDPPASSYAIMRRARPYRGENPAPGEDVDGELDPTAGIREQPRPEAEVGRRGATPCCTSPSPMQACRALASFRSQPSSTKVRAQNTSN